MSKKAISYNFPSFSQVDPKKNSVKKIIDILKNCGFKFPIEKYRMTEVHRLSANGKILSVIGVDHVIMLFYNDIKPVYAAFVVKQRKEKIKIECVGTGKKFLFHNEFGPAAIIRQENGGIVENFYIRGDFVDKAHLYKNYILKHRIKDVKNEI